MLLFVLALVAACSVDDPNPAPGSGALPAVVVDGLDRPTQLFVDDDGWLISQLAGPESGAVGQVVAVDPEVPGDVTVLVEGLDVPTGVARFAGDVWVMTAERLLRFDPASAGSPPWSVDDGLVAAGPLPNNGRSQGTLAVIGERLFFDTSGSIRGGEVVAGSGRLWAIDGDGVITEVAQGFKHAYAVLEFGDSLVVTEVSDGTFDGTPSADALVRLESGADHGWPRCVARPDDLERRPVAEFGGTAADCSVLPPLVARFPSGATPTSLAPVPWSPDRVAVVLWQERRVVSLTPGDPESEEVLLAPGDLAPIGVVADGDRLLVVDFDGGRVVSLSEPG